MAKPLTVPLFNGIPKLNMAIYGEGGAGKTTLAAGFAADPRTSPALWIDAMGNPQLFILSGKIQYGISIEKWQDLEEPLEFLLQKQPARHSFRRTYEQLTGTPLPPEVIFKSLVIDTFTFEQQKLIDYIVDYKPSSGKNVVPGTTKVDAKIHGGEIAGTTLALMHQILSSPVHTFVTYQVYDKLIFTAGDGGQVLDVGTKSQIHLYGSARNLIPPWHNLMGKLDYVKKLVKDDKGKQVAMSVPVIYWRDTESTGKNQIAPSLGEQLEFPTASKILDAIEEDWSSLNNSSAKEQGE